MVYILIFIFIGYLFSRLLTEDKSNLAYIILFSLGTAGIIFFLNIFIWDFISMYGILIFSIPIISIMMAIIIYGDKKLLGPVEFSFSDLIILGILLIFGAQQLYGYWDAWAMWNTKASFLISGHWQSIFSEEINWMHPDYPLLLPSVVAGIQFIFNTSNPIAPFVVALLFSWSICLLLKDALFYYFKKTYGVLVSLLAISVPAFIFWSGSQYADIPLAAFLLLGVLILLKAKDSLSILISGLALGFAVFTKNEGAMYLGIILLSYIYSSWRVDNRVPFKSISLLIVGALPGIITSLMVKSFAIQNEFISNLWGRLSLISFQRGFIIAREFFYEFINWREWMFVWVLLVLFILFKNRKSPKVFEDIFLTSLITFSFISFIFIYLVTPKDLVWHIQTSFNRLLIQILPLVLFLFSGRLKEELLAEIKCHKTQLRDIDDLEEIQKRARKCC